MTCPEGNIKSLIQQPQVLLILYYNKIIMQESNDELVHYTIPAGVPLACLVLIVITTTIFFIFLEASGSTFLAYW